MPAKIIDFIAPHKRKTESEIEISKVEKMALDKKMSYGQYVAMLEEEKKKDYMQHYIKNNAIDSVKVAVENGELSISTANEIAKHNATKQQEIISSPIEKIKTANVRNINKDKSKAKMPKCDEPKIDSTSDEATEIYLTTDEIMFMKKNLDILGFSYLLSVSSDSDNVSRNGLEIMQCMHQKSSAEKKLMIFSLQNSFLCCSMNGISVFVVRKA